MIIVFERDDGTFLPRESAVEYTEHEKLSCVHATQVLLQPLSFHELEETASDALRGVLAQPGCTSRVLLQ